MPIGETSDFYKIFNQGKIFTISTFVDIKLKDEPGREDYTDTLVKHLFSITNQKELEEAEQRIFRCSTARELIFTIEELDNGSDRKLIKQGIDLFIKAGKLHREGKSTEEIQEETGLDREQVEDIQKLL